MPTVPSSGGGFIAAQHITLTHSKSVHFNHNIETMDWIALAWTITVIYWSLGLILIAIERFLRVLIDFAFLPFNHFDPGPDPQREPTTEEFAYEELRKMLTDEVYRNAFHEIALEELEEARDNAAEFRQARRTRRHLEIGLDEIDRLEVVNRRLSRQVNHLLRTNAPREVMDGSDLAF